MYHDAKALGPLDEPFLGSGRSSDSLPEVATGRPPKQPGQQTKAELSVRWWVLVLASFVLFGNYYCYDNPAALYTQLRSAFGDGDADFALDFGMLYSVYSLPNVVLPLIGGVLVDRVGVRFSLFLFSLLVLAGQIVCVLGAAAGSLPLLLLGRAIFGLGGESISVAQNAIVTEWFSGAELAMALGANLSIGRVGSVVNNCVSPYIAHRASLTSAFGFGAVLCAGSFLCALALNVVDSRAEQRLRREARRARRRDRAAELHRASAPAPSAEAGSAGVIDGRADLEARSEPREGLVTPPRGRAEGEGEAGGAPGGTTPRFSRQFWLLMVCCVVSYCCVLPFNNVASAVLQAREYFPFGTRWREGGHRKFVYTPATPEPTDVKCATAFGRHLPFCRDQERAQQRAALVMSEPFLVSAALAPLLGHLVDKHGGKARRTPLPPRGPRAVGASARPVRRATSLCFPPPR